MDDDFLKVRLSSASRYHAFLAKNLHASWFDVFAEIESSSKYGVSEAMVLLHPRWYQEIGLNAVTDPRGPSTFSGLKQKARCRAKELWGYECPYSEAEIHVDHTFPYSRGGLTQPDNAMYLCREHNLSKSTDLHLIPWETFPGLSWIQFGVNSAIKSAQSRSKFEIFPIRAALKHL
jgi:hypothetical protein